MSARTLVADALDLHLEGFQVIRSYRAPDGLEGPVCVVYRETVTNRITWDDNEVRVWVLDPHQDPERAEDPLDGWLTTVLSVLDAQANLAWSTAERGVFNDTWHGYQITVTVTTRKEQE